MYRLPPTPIKDEETLSPAKIRTSIGRLYEQYDRGSVDHRVFVSRLCGVLGVSNLPQSVVELVKTKRPDFSLVQLMRSLRQYHDQHNQRPPQSSHTTESDVTSPLVKRDYGQTLNRRKRSDRALWIQGSAGVQAVLNSDGEVNSPVSSDGFESRVRRNPRAYHQVFGEGMHEKDTDMLWGGLQRTPQQVYATTTDSPLVQSPQRPSTATTYSSEHENTTQQQQTRRHYGERDDETRGEPPLYRLLDELLVRYGRDSGSEATHESSVRTVAHMIEGVNEHFLLRQHDWNFAQQCMLLRQPVHVHINDGCIREVFQLYAEDRDALFIFNERLHLSYLAPSS